MSLEGLALGDEVPVGHKGDGTKVPKAIVETKGIGIRRFAFATTFCETASGAANQKLVPD